MRYFTPVAEWILPCDCCRKTIKKIKNDSNDYDNYNLDDTPHEKHNKIWASTIASFSHYKEPFAKVDLDSKVGDLTLGELENQLEMKLNFKFGKYVHGLAGFKEIWLTPKKYTYCDVDYYVSGNIDGEEDGKLIELKTTWVTSKAKIQPVIEKARTQADIYAWMADYKEAKIIVKCLAKPELDTIIFHKTQSEQVESLFSTFIDENKEQIKQY